MVASGLFECSACIVEAVAAAGDQRLNDTDGVVLCGALSLLRAGWEQQGCEARIRRLAHSLTFCLQYDLDVMNQLGVATAAYAAQLCTPTHRYCTTCRVDNGNDCVSLRLFCQAALCLEETRVDRNSPFPSNPLMA